MCPLSCRRLVRHPRAFAALHNPVGYYYFGLHTSAAGAYGGSANAEARSVNADACDRVPVCFARRAGIMRIVNCNLKSGAAEQFVFLPAGGKNKSATVVHTPATL